MIQRTWNLQIEPGATNPTWDRRAIPMALGRISRYFNVTFPQVTRNPWMRVVMTRRHPNKSWAAWTTGRTIYIPQGFRYQSLDQLVFILVHEFGHVFGGSSHGKSGDVMEDKIRDVYRNFTQNDYWWFRSLPQKPIKAWTEPNHWRPQQQIEDRMFMALLAEEWQCTVDQLCDYAHGSVGAPNITCGHGSWLDRIRGMMTKTTILEVE
jgi:hypothetical protein